MLAVTLVMTGCQGSDAVSEPPPVPPELVAHAENPFGDAVNARITRASLAARDLLEPRWGRLESRVYTLPAARRADLLRRLSATPPPGFTMLPIQAFPEDRGTLHAFNSGRKLYALLLVKEDDRNAEVIPAVLFDNLDLVR